MVASQPVTCLFPTEVPAQISDGTPGRAPSSLSLMGIPMRRPPYSCSDCGQKFSCPPCWPSTGGCTQERSPTPAPTVAFALSTLPCSSVTGLFHCDSCLFPCPECGKSFKCKYALEAHQWVHHPGGKRLRWQQAAAGCSGPGFLLGGQDPPIHLCYFPDIFQECG